MISNTTISTSATERCSRPSSRSTATAFSALFIAPVSHRTTGLPKNHTDFEINAGATLTLLELTRQHCSGASFIFMSTNKVYGDTPNELDITEKERRYEVADGFNAIDETMSIDRCKHSLFGVSKLSADLMVQEYGRYFGMNTVCFRAGCITGPNHQGAELHGFISYLVKCIVRNELYSIYGYKGKQVRDNIHSYDLVNAFWQYHLAPKPAAVYNIGGGRENSLSILETFDLVNSITRTTWNKHTYVDEARSGDHIWYISDLSKLKSDYPNWDITHSVERIVRDIVCSQSTGVVTSVLQGGIGNQLFLISLAYAAARHTNRKLVFLKNQFFGCRQGSHPSTYYGNFFSKLTFTEDASLMANSKTIRERSLLCYDLMPEVTHVSTKYPDTPIAFFGYFQSDEYFKEYSQEIRELFTPNGGIAEYLKRNSDVLTRFPSLSDTSTANTRAFIGIRRGDFIKHAHIHNPCGMTYYNAAIERLKNSVGVIQEYYILTDDFAWARQNFQGEEYKFLEIEGDTHQLMASTLFKNYIISNSTFYWWGSFLSIYPPESLTCIAPDKWTNGFPADYKGCYRSDMEIVERPIESK